MTDFLPEDLLTSTDDGEYEPRRLLDSIAAEFDGKTGGSLLGEVNTRYPQSQTVEHQFYLVTPIPRYSYLLFSVTHGIDGYPVTIDGPGQGQQQVCEDRAELEAALQTTFKEQRVRKLVNQLVRSAS